MKKSVKYFMAILLVTILSCQLFAADGVVTFISGKVNVKKGSNWVPLSVGDSISQNDMINTGFQSEAKIKLMDNLLYIGPVTRVTLDTLASSSDTDKVNLYLTTGSVRSKVNRNREQVKRVSYTVTTPIAVASVRGTDFIINGESNVTCNEGKVAVIPTSFLKDLVNEPKVSVSPEENVEDKEKSTEEGLKTVEDAANLEDVGEVIEADMVIQVPTPTSTSGAMHKAEQKAEKMLNTVFTESTRPSDDDDLSGAAFNKFKDFANSSMSISINNPVFGILHMNIMIPEN